MRVFLYGLSWCHARWRAQLLVGFRSGVEPAIDIEHCSGNERGLGAGEKYDAGGDFLRTAEALQRMQAALGLGELAAILRIHVGVDRAGLHHVHSDAVRTKVARRALGVT